MLDEGGQKPLARPLPLLGRRVAKGSKVLSVCLLCPSVPWPSMALPSWVGRQAALVLLHTQEQRLEAMELPSGALPGQGDGAGSPPSLPSASAWDLVVHLGAAPGHLTSRWPGLPLLP